MIQELREYSQSFLFKLLLGVICVTFVVSFGVGSFGDRKEVIAKVNGREILLKDYRKAYQNRLQSLRQQFGENADAFAEQINLRQRVFEQMIDQEPVSYTHLRAHETDSYLVCRLLLEKNL